MTADREVSILMYHSIANGRGPLAIPPRTFHRQLDALAERGFRAVALRDYIALLDGGKRTDRVVVLTFDDGYADFATAVVPDLEARGWSCTVFLSTNLIGSASGWDPDGNGRRQLIEWTQAMEFSRRGFEIGAHGVTHADLTRLDFDRACREVDDSKRTIEDRLGSPVVSFAAPYGRITPELRAHASQSFQCAVGTRMATATAVSDRYDLPRIDMWYFRSQARWNAYLDGARTYFTVRQMLRRVRQRALESSNAL
jgi:peptidoglycan/xylan/chitin deacetylase (PgdA/CDA1 family)